jgi:DsbC/DsbD-like thiol-disulfide interchange protein
MVFFKFIWLLSVLLSKQPDVVSVAVTKASVTAGKTDTLRLKVQVKEGFHIQGNILKDESLVPTTLTLSHPDGIETGAAVFPPAKEFLLQGTEDPLDVYDGSFEIVVPLKATPSLQKGSYTLQAALRYQACDVRTCFFPKTKEFYIPLQVQKK